MKMHITTNEKFSLTPSHNSDGARAWHHRTRSGAELPSGLPLAPRARLST